MSLPSSIVCNPLKRRLKLAEPRRRRRGQCARSPASIASRSTTGGAPVRDPRPRLCVRAHRRTDRCAQAHRDRRRLRVSLLCAGCDRRRTWRRRPDRRRRPGRGAADAGHASDRSNARRQSLRRVRVDQTAERLRYSFPHDVRRHHAGHHVAAHRRLDRDGRSIARDHPGERPRHANADAIVAFCRTAFCRRLRRRVGILHRPTWQPFVTVRSAPLACRQDRADGPGRLYVALFGRPRYPLLPRRRRSARRAARLACVRRGGAEGLRRRAPSQGREPAARVARQPELVRARRRAHRHAVRAVRVRAAHRQHAHHLCTRREGGAGAGAQRRCDRRAAGGRREQPAAAADVRADHAARAHHPQPRGGVADVHVFVQGRHRDRLAPGASRQPRRRRRRPRDHGDDRRAAGRPHQPALRRHVCARACRRRGSASPISSTSTARPRSPCSSRMPAARAR